jgi:hypothetical protein
MDKLQKASESEWTTHRDYRVSRVALLFRNSSYSVLGERDGARACGTRTDRMLTENTFGKHSTKDQEVEGRKTLRRISVWHAARKWGAWSGSGLHPASCILIASVWNIFSCHDNAPSLLILVLLLRICMCVVLPTFRSHLLHIGNSAHI